MGEIVVSALCFGWVGFLAGGCAGMLVGFLLRNLQVRSPRKAQPRDGADSLTDSEVRDLRAERRRAARRPGKGSGVVTLGYMVGGLLGFALATYLGYKEFFFEFPPGNYPDWPSFQTAEMEHRARQLDPLIAALEKYKRDNGRYPADLSELVTRGHLHAIPPEPASDHLGKHKASEYTGESRYYVTPTGDQFVLLLDVRFSMGYQRSAREIWVYDTRAPGWGPGTAPADWPHKRLRPERTTPEPKGGPATGKQ